MKLISLLLLPIILLFASGAQAAVPPPYIATLEGKNLTFPGSSCASAANSALKQAGFARVSSAGGTVFGAYHAGRDYRYKAAVKCLDEYNLVVVTIVASGSGALNTARKVLSNIRNKATAGSGLYAYNKPDGDDAAGDSCPEPADADECDCPEPPPVVAPNTALDCADGPTLVRCLNSVPQSDIDLAIDYLDKLKQ